MNDVIRVYTLTIAASTALMAFMIEWCLLSHLITTCQRCQQQVRLLLLLKVISKLVLAISLIVKWLALAVIACIVDSKPLQSTLLMIYCLVVTVEGVALSFAVIALHLNPYK